MTRNKLNNILGLPGIIFLSIFFFTPSLFIFRYIFGSRTRTGKTSFDKIYFDSFSQLLDFNVVPIINKSVVTAFFVTLICFIVGYPFAYYIKKLSTTMKYFSLFLISIPFLTNFLSRNLFMENFSFQKWSDYKVRQYVLRRLFTIVYRFCSCIRYGICLPPIYDSSNIYIS
jgi:ABC-type spermidine/putrescine transport system permease subunit I